MNNNLKSRKKLYDQCIKDFIFSLIKFKFFYQHKIIYLPDQTDDEILENTQRLQNLIDGLKKNPNKFFIDPDELFEKLT